MRIELWLERVYYVGVMIEILESFKLPILKSLNEWWEGLGLEGQLITRRMAGEVAAVAVLASIPVVVEVVNQVIEMIKVTR